MPRGPPLGSHRTGGEEMTLPGELVHMGEMGGLNLVEAGFRKVRAVWVGIQEAEAVGLRLEAGH